MKAHILLKYVSNFLVIQFPVFTYILEQGYADSYIVADSLASLKGHF